MEYFDSLREKWGDLEEKRAMLLRLWAKFRNFKGRALIFCLFGNHLTKEN